MYNAIPCPCGHRACKSWQVQGIAPEAKFTKEQAEAVAKTLNELGSSREQATHIHWKGGLYRLIGKAKDSDNPGEDVAVYEHLWPHVPELWIRSWEDFNGVHENGRKRFEEIK